MRKRDFKTILADKIRMAESHLHPVRPEYGEPFALSYLLAHIPQAPLNRKNTYTKKPESSPTMCTKPKQQLLGPSSFPQSQIEASLPHSHLSPTQIGSLKIIERHIGAPLEPLNRLNVKNQYHKMCLELHPDLNPNKNPDEFLKIKVAFEALFEHPKLG